VKLVALTAALSIGCVGSGELQTQISGQLVGETEKPLGPGLVLLERGPVHDGAYERCGVVDPDGRFSIDLPVGGVWGIHLFHDDYSYLPAEFEIAEKQQLVLTSPMVVWGDWMDRTGVPTWPDQPANPQLIRMPWDDLPSDNPTLRDLTMTWKSSDILEITVVAEDPDHDLSRMILACNQATGDGYAFNPPGPPVDGLYPDGTYTLTVFRDELDRPGESKWFFIVSDDLCNNSPVLEAPLPPLP